MGADAQMRATLKSIFAAAKERQHQESDRLGESEDRQDSGING